MDQRFEVDSAHVLYLIGHFVSLETESPSNLFKIWNVGQILNGAKDFRSGVGGAGASVLTLGLV